MFLNCFTDKLIWSNNLQILLFFFQMGADCSTPFPCANPDFLLAEICFPVNNVFKLLNLKIIYTGNIDRNL